MISLYVDGLRSSSCDFTLENQPHARPEIEVGKDEFGTVVEADTSHTTSELATDSSVSIPDILDHLKEIGKEAGQMSTT